MRHRLIDSQQIVRSWLMGVACGIGGFVVIAFGFSLLASVGWEPDWGGDKAAVLWGVLFGLPMGAASGIALVSRAALPAPGSQWWRWIAACILGAIGAILALALTNGLGSLGLLAAPPLAALFGELAYLPAWRGNV